MLDLLLAHGANQGNERALLRAIEAHEAVILKSAGLGDGGQVGRAEAVLRVDPGAGFVFDASGGADLVAGGRKWRAGRFDSVSLGDLRARAADQAKRGDVRLWVFDGVSPATDIGSLQAHANGNTLFQVASQFNCLESGGPWIRHVEGYFNDSTQGPRASISAFPGTLLRHYQAPDLDGGRFTQASDGRQVELLVGVCTPGVAAVRNGYLLAADIVQPRAFVDILERRFDAIRVGIHDDVEVALGYDWNGAVEATPRITQVFTSTVAGGAYGQTAGDILDVCRQLLRAAYLGTLLGAVTLGRTRVVLTLIGGGVFCNPLPLIWEAILWALDEVTPLLSQDIDVVVNGRNIGAGIDHATLLSAVRERGGAVLEWGRAGGGPRIHR